jgi:N-acetylmuramoyl-L-alanine amidase
MHSEWMLSHTSEGRDFVRRLIIILCLIIPGIPIANAINPGMFADLFQRTCSVSTKDSVSVGFIQEDLMRLGYYKGNINGVFNDETSDAVKRFQTANSIKADGRMGYATVECLRDSIITMAQKSSNAATANRDLMLLARAINGEARGEPYIGAVAVGAVIINRTRDPKFPNTIAGVVYQPGAFTAVTDGQIDAGMEPQALKAAQDALNGWDPSGGAIYYYNPAKTTNKWIWSRPLIKIIGKHRFCK